MSPIDDTTQATADAAEPVVAPPAEEGIAALEPVAPAPVARVSVAMMASIGGANTALLVPTVLLLTLHLSDLVGEDRVAGALGLVTGTGAIAAIVANPIAGRLSDRTRNRFGRRRTWMLTGGLTSALAVAAAAFTTEVWQVVVVWCLVQGLVNLQLAATSAVLPDQVSPARRGLISGLIGLATGAVPLVVLAAVIHLEPTTQWLVTGAGAGLLAVVAVLVLRESRVTHEPEPFGWRVLLSTFWVDPRRHPAFAWAWAVRFLCTAAGAANVYHGVYLLRQLHLPRADLGDTVLLLSVITVVIGGIAAVVGGQVSDRLRRQKPFIVAAAAFYVVGLVMLAYARSLTVVIAATVVSAVGTGVFLAVDVALSSRMLPDPERLGKDFAVINLANTLPASIVPLLAPGLLALGGFPALYLTLACFGVAGALCVLRLPELGREGDPRFALLVAAR